MTTTTLANGTVLTNATIAAGNIDLVTDNTVVYLQGTLQNAGTLELNATGDATQLILDSATVSLTGGGTLLLSNNPTNEIFGNGGGNDVLINVNNKIEGAGYLGINNGNDPLALTNGTAGIIDANDSNALIIEPGGPAVINNGLMEATGTGGLVITNGAVINQTGGGRLFASGTGDNVYFQTNAQIIGGTLTGTLGGGFQINSGTAVFGDGGTDTLTIAKSTTVQVDDNTQLDLLGTINNLGTLALASTGDATVLLIDSPTVSLIGGGTLLLSNNPANEIYGNGGGNETLINVNNSIQGAGNLGVNNGNIPLALTNEKAGVIDANGTVALIIQTGGPALVNAGLLEATGTGGLVITNSTAIVNTGTLLASGAGDNIYLQNGADIIGGVLKGTGGGIIAVNSGVAAIDGSTAAVTIALGTTLQVDDNQQLDVLGTIDNLGTLAMASTGDSTNIFITGPTLTLIGGGTLALSDNVNNRIYGDGGGDQTLINVNNLIEGAGQLGINNGNVPLALTNDSAGIIDANGTAALYIQTGGPALINDGLLEATGIGGLIIGGTVIDDTGGGVIKAVGTGSVVQLINGADIAGGTLATSNGGLIEIASGSDTLDGSTAPVTITAGSTVQLNDNQQLYLLGTIDLIGTLALASTGDGTNLILDSTIVTLLGGGTLAMSDNIYNRIYGISGTDQTLINVDDTIAGAGQIGVNNGNVPLALTNDVAGVIDASSTAALFIQTGGPALVNAGLIEATNTGGLLITNGSAIDQTGGTLLASGAGDNVYLQNGADIVGGVLQGTGGGLFLANYGNVSLDGSTAAVTLATATNLQLSDSQQLYLLGTIDNLGTIALESTGDSTNLLLASPTVTLLGGGELLLSDNIYNRIYGNGGGTDTLLNVNNTIAGAGQLGVNNSNVPLALTNEAAGVIDATGTASLYLQTGGPALINAGLIEATNTGGIVVINTAIDQTGGTLLAAGAGNNVYLEGGATIVGGVLKATGGGIIEVNNGNAFLDGSTAALTIALGTTVQLEDNQQLFLLGTIDNAGTLNINAGGDSTNLFVDSPTVSLVGGGTLLLSATGAARIYGVGGADDTLINVNNTIVGAGDLGVNNGNIPLALTNATAGVIDADDAAPLYIQSGGPQDSNAGLIEATSGGSLLVVNTAITNSATGTIAAFNASTVNFDSNSDLVNAAAGTLTGGTYGAFATTGAATLDLTGGGPVAVDAANLVLSGTNATIGFYNNGGYTAIDTSLTEVTGAGTLQIDNGRTYATTNQLTIDTGGHLDLAAGTLAPAALTSAGTIFGYGSIAGGLTNTGKIEASGGKLTVGGSVAGGGAIAIDAGAAFELGSASSEAITFAPGLVQSGTFVAGAAILDKPSLYTGTFTNLAAGDTIDLAGTLASSASIAGTKLVVSLTAGGTLSYNLANPASGTRVAVSSDGHGGTDIIDFKEATASAISPTPVNFGEHHTAFPQVETYTITNTAPANQYSEKLNASMGATTGAVTDSGSVSGLSAGATNNSALHATLASSNGGVVSGTATVNLSSTGAGVTGDGLGTLALPSETVALSGTFYNFATASTAAPVNFGQGHVGGTLSHSVAIANTASPGIYSENLDASVSGTSAGLTGSGSVSELAAGSTSASGLALSLSGTAAGVQTGTGTIALASDGAGIDTLGVTSLPSETVTATGTLFNEATASAQPGTISFGIVHVGQSVSQFLTLTNTASPGIYSENLDGGFSGTSASVSTTGTISELAAGGTSSALDVSLQTSKAGTISGFTTLNLTSDGTGIDSLGTTALGADTIAVTGTVNHYATVGVALLSGPGALSAGAGGVLKLNLGTVTQNSTGPAESIGIVNSAVGPADLLKGNLSLSGTTSAFTNNSAISFTGLAAGGTSTGHTISLHTNTVGTFTETIVLSPTGYNASGYAGALAPDTLVVTGTVTAAQAAPHAMAFLAPAPAPAPALTLAPQDTTPLTGLAAWLHLPDLRAAPAAGFAPASHAVLATAAPPVQAIPTASGAGLLTPLLYHNPQAAQAALLGRTG